MSTTSQDSITRALQSILSAQLGSQILANFFTGMYTVLYLWTMYLCVSGPKSRQWVVISAISILYALYLGNWAFDWYMTNVVLVFNGATQTSIGLADGSINSGTVLAIAEFLAYAPFVVSDALLIWRCYHVLGKSLWAISVPVVFLVAETGLIIILILFTGKPVLNNKSIAALGFVSLGTTMIATFLIGYRIHAATRANNTISKNRFQYIVTLILESAALSSFGLLISSLYSIIPWFLNTITGTCVVFYMNTICTILIAISPTVLVARLAMKTPEDAMSAPTAMVPSDLIAESAPGDEGSNREDGLHQPSNLPNELSELHELAPDDERINDHDGTREPSDTPNEISEIEYSFRGGNDEESHSSGAGGSIRV